MARHRNVRKLDFDDGKHFYKKVILHKYSFFWSEYGYDDIYGQSLEDEPAVSPSTAGKCTQNVLSIKS